MLWLRSRNRSLPQAAKPCLSFLMSVALMMPGEKGPRNAVCVTAAAAAETCPGQPLSRPRVVAGAQESPGAVGEAGRK